MNNNVKAALVILGALLAILVINFLTFPFVAIVAAIPLVVGALIYTRKLLGGDKGFTVEDR